MLACAEVYWCELMYIYIYIYICNTFVIYIYVCMKITFPCNLDRFKPLSPWAPWDHSRSLMDFAALWQAGLDFPPGTSSQKLGPDLHILRAINMRTSTLFYSRRQNYRKKKGSKNTGADGKKKRHFLH